MDASGNTEKCSCEEAESQPSCSTDKEELENPNPIASTSLSPRKTKISLPGLGLNLRKGRSLNFALKRSKKSSGTEFPLLFSTIKKSSKWVMKLNCSKTKPPKDPENQACCQCTCYRRTEEHHLGAGVVFSNEDSNDCRANSSKESSSNDASEQNSAVKDDIVVAASNDTPQERPNIEQEPQVNVNVLNRDIYSGPAGNIVISAPFSFLDVHWLHNFHEDCDEAARLQRAREIEQGVEVPASARPPRRVQLVCSDVENDNGQTARRLQLVCPPDLTVDSLRALFQNHITLRSCPLDSITGCHTQVDFIHCLVPDLLDITNCSFYWGKMDRYEAERLLDGKPEGTFLLRDSAQEEFLFSVSFRKYGRSLHARIEQWNHKFSFDSHDPGVYTSDTVCGLIKHYKDPSSCMFFEPMLTWPLHRNFVFPLQHLCRAVIVSRITYDDVNQLQLPKCLKAYLKEYHYRQKVRVERFDDDVQWLDLRNVQA